MGKFSDYFRRKPSGDERSDDSTRADENYDYYEDTHDLNGGYTARLRDFQRESLRSGAETAERGFEREQSRLSTFSSEPDEAKIGTSGSGKYQNFMVYEPKTADDVQTLIDFLKTKESAIINLDNVDDEISQRVLDFVSGAIYALNGSVHRVAGNIFLLSPEGVGITNSYEMKGNARKQ